MDTPPPDNQTSASDNLTLYDSPPTPSDGGSQQTYQDILEEEPSLEDRYSSHTVTVTPLKAVTRATDGVPSPFTHGTEKQDVHVVVDNKEDGGKEKVDEEDKEKDDGEDKELLENDSIRIELDDADKTFPPDGEGEDTPTLPMPDKKKPIDKANKIKEPPSMFLFPITRMKIAWTSSSTTFEFLIRSVCIIFTSLGWLFCIGGFPLMSFVMLIMGSVYLEDCPAQPLIPVYLVVAGVFGTLQHAFTVWTKYVPRDIESPGSKYRSSCISIEFVLEVFLGIWFILGCVWVYGLYEPEYKKSDYPGQENNYCNKTIYLFTFWILNISFIALAILIAFAFCCIISIAGSPKETTVMSP